MKLKRLEIIDYYENVQPYIAGEPIQYLTGTLSFLSINKEKRNGTPATLKIMPPEFRMILKNTYQRFSVVFITANTSPG